MSQRAVDILENVMSNPFICYDSEKQCEYPSSLCSLNRVIIDKVPVKGIDDSIEGMRANDIFSAKVISDDIRRTAKAMHVDVSHYTHRELPRLISDGIMSDDVMLRRLATTIASKYGNRLGLILLTLKTGLEENRLARPEWDSRHWEYWANIKNVMLTGGLASGLMGKRFKEQIHYVFDMAGVKPYNISLYENSSHIGALGCARLIKESDKTFAVLDLGQTNIKRCIVKKRGGELSHMITLETMPSMNMELDYSDSEENFNRALELHRYILNVVCDTCKHMSDIGASYDEIIISIANYVVGGTLNPKRGGYAKLCLLSADYAEMLSEEISSRMRRAVRVKLVHDGAAIALNFSGHEDTVCVSLGTAFGVGFPCLKIE